MNYTKNPKHSKFLRKYFKISIDGVDYINENGVKFEFKETIKNIQDNMKPTQIRFNCCLFHLINSHYYVFCFRDNNFFIVPSIKIVEHYSFDNNYDLCNVSIKFINDNNIYKTDNIIELQNKIIEIKK